jgi:hypothetical protein
MSGSGRADAFTLGEGALQVELWRDSADVPGSAYDVHRYGREIPLSPERGQATGVEVRVGGKAASTAVLLCDEGCPGIAESRAVLHGETLFVCVKDHVAALALPSLQVRWATDVDDACVFALDGIPGADALLVRGELQITRLGMDGRIQWQRGGADIFTGGCRIEDDVVVAVDWNGAVYRWRLADGEVVEAPAVR